MKTFFTLALFLCLLSGCSFRWFPSSTPTALRRESEVVVLPDGSCRIHQKIHAQDFTFGPGFDKCPSGSPDDPETRQAFALMQPWFRDAVDTAVPFLQRGDEEYQIEIVGTLPNLSLLVQHAPDLLGPQGAGMTLDQDAEGRLRLSKKNGKGVLPVDDQIERIMRDDLSRWRQNWIEEEMHQSRNSFDLTLRFAQKIHQTTFPLKKDGAIHWSDDNRNPEKIQDS